MENVKKYNVRTLTVVAVEILTILGLTASMYTFLTKGGLDEVMITVFFVCIISGLFLLISEGKTET